MRGLRAEVSVPKAALTCLRATSSSRTRSRAVANAGYIVGEAEVRSDQDALVIHESAAE